MTAPTPQTTAGVENDADPYAPRVTFWQRRPHLGWALAVFASTWILTCAAFPPINAGEAAYALAIPAALWAYRRPPFKIFAWSVLGAQVAAWTTLLSWLHHVTIAGWLMLGPVIGLLIGAWYLAAWWVIPRLAGHSAFIRIVAFLGLAGFWVMLEWVRGWLFGGFPWLPLAASQWERPVVLQMASYGGAWAVSFVLVLFNLGCAAYAHRIFYEGATGLRKRSPEFMAGLMLLVFSSFPLLHEMMGARRVEVGKIALVQPYIPQTIKWDNSKASEILQTIERVTLEGNEAGVPDAIVWPEAVVPWPLYRDPGVQQWLESLSRRTGKPMLVGTVFTDNAAPEDKSWYNGAFVIDPKLGLQPRGYAKRELVPFGEFVPLRSVLGWLEKVVPIGGDFQRGTDASPLPFQVGRKTVQVGPLICYEDIFPQLARESVRGGAEVLAVLTNNGWFGEGGAAYQHASHSVLRAVENRRPVIRVGNGGWSGWIDEAGYIRANLRDENGSVYFRGAQAIKLTRDARWQGRESFYTRHGDWMLVLSAILATAAYYVVLTLRPSTEKRF